MKDARFVIASRFNKLMTTEIDRAERSVEEQSVALKKPLGLGDLVLTQIVFVVGSSWVGTAAKLGKSHLFFWLLAILLFYIPQAAVVIYLSRLMPLEGGIYQWAKLAFNEFTGFIVAWNLWLLSIMVIAMGGMFITTNISYALGRHSRVDARQSLVCFARQSCAGKWPRVDWRSRAIVRQVGAQHRRLRDVPGLWRLDFATIHQSRSRRSRHISAASNRSARDVALLLLQYL